MALEPFAEDFPDRFFNVGVAEQNMIGLATGLAQSGFLPFCYSIATFASLRAYEFTRNGPLHHRLPVRIVGVGGGFEYGTAGPSHHGLEDAGVMRIQPGMTVVAPADHLQARSALLETWNLPGPIYYRLGKDDKTTIPGLDGRFRLGRTEVVREGSDALIVAMGAVAAEAAAGAELLTARGIATGMHVIASIAPPPVDDLLQALASVPLVVTVEAHYLSGGIGSLVAEVIAEHSLSCRLVRLAVRSQGGAVTGSQDYLHESHGLTTAAIVGATHDALRMQPS